MNSNTTLQNDLSIPNVQLDSISCVRFSPTQDILAATSWDGSVRLWEVSSQGQAMEKLTVQHQAPLMTAAFSQDGTKCFIGGAPSGQHCGRLIDMTTGQHLPFAQHQAAVKEALFGTVQQQPNVLVTGSWDKTLKYWDVRQPNAVLTLNVPERVYSMDATGPLMTVATAERHVLVYNLTNPGQVYKQITVPLKYQTRSIANFCTNGINGFAIGSIEGRVAIHHVEDKDQGTNFTFKCHRLGNDVFSVNNITFHPVYGTFSTAGSDGALNFWDKDSKQRLKQFSSVGTSITSQAFSRNGTILAYAVSYDWSKGHEGRPQPDTNKIMLHSVQDVDIKPRAGIKKR